MVRKGHLVMFVGLLALVALPLTATAQPSQQQISIQPEHMEWRQVPEELPGTYRAYLEVRTMASGGLCVCAPGTTTTVELAGSGPEEVGDVVVSPSSYVIDWWQHTGAWDHHQVVEVVFHMKDTDADIVKIKLDTQGHTNSPAHNTVGLASEYAVPLPSEFHGEHQEENASASDDGNRTHHASASSGTSDAEDIDASSQSHSAAEVDPPGFSMLPELSVGAAMAGLVIVAIRRRGLT